MPSAWGTTILGCVSFRAVLPPVVLACAASAWAGPPDGATLRLELDSATRACFSAPRLEAAIERRLGRRVFDPALARPLVIDARVSRSEKPGEWHVFIQTSDEAGVRGTRSLSLAAQSCEALLEPIALILTLTIDPSPTPSPAPPAPPPPPPPEPPPPPAPPPWSFLVLLSAGATSGPAPAWGPQGELRATMLPPSGPLWEVGLRATATAVPAPRGAEARFTAFGALLGLCPLHRAWARVGFAACFGGTLFTVEGRGLGFDQTRRDRAWVPGALGATQVHLRWGGRFVLSGRVEAGLWGRVRQYTFVDESGDEQPLAEGTRAATNVTLGAGVLF